MVNEQARIDYKLTNWQIARERTDETTREQIQRLLPGHVWATDSQGRIDLQGWAEGPHIGIKCLVCGIDRCLGCEGLPFEAEEPCRGYFLPGESTT